MENELTLNPSDSELFDDIPESSPSPVIPPRQPARTRSTIHAVRRSQPPSTGGSNTIGPSPPHSSRGRSRARRPTDTPHSSRSGRSLRDPAPPRRFADRPSAPNIAEWTVVRLKRALTQRNITFHSTDNKAKLFQQITDSQQNSTLHRTTPRPLPGSQRRARGSADDVTHPHQPSLRARQELDDYVSLVLDLALRFGAAGRLQQFNQGTYWGTLDTELYCRVFSARASLNCDQCGAPSHPTTTCTLTASLPRTSYQTNHNPAVFHSMPPTAPPPTITPKPVNIQPIALGPLPKGVDKRGRPILYQGGRMVCNKFNDLGCKVASCRFLHTCSFCGKAHARSTCPHNPTKHGLCKYLNTPININALTAALKNHPDRNFISFAHSILKIKSTTIQAYISGINFFTKLSAAAPCQATSHSYITMLIKGLRKTEVHTAPKRSPLTSDLLILCIRTLRSGYSSPYVDKVLESMFLLAFFGFLRCSEFTVSTSKYNPSCHASISDISIQSTDTLIYHLKCSKTNQSGLPQPIYLFRLDSYISPFEPIQEYTNSRLASRASPQDPLFVTETGQVATRHWFHCHFRQILSQSGVSPEQYSGHSFRIGAASSASKQGIPDNTINPRPMVFSCLSHIHSK
ncbi:hypothetical protein N1851_018939 [Merluccius polli]|uniref:Uncharacterized protein n=1 Tax=Merluccius polli TaxID=89951 RepID=A0AA47MMT8_MERPO|nr:hypothetical protein N1851_018939 [Merluccius polli]